MTVIWRDNAMGVAAQTLRHDLNSITSVVLHSASVSQALAQKCGINIPVTHAHMSKAFLLCLTTICSYKVRFLVHLTLRVPSLPCRMPGWWAMG